MASMLGLLWVAVSRPAMAQARAGLRCADDRAGLGQRAGQQPGGNRLPPGGNRPQSSGNPFPASGNRNNGPARPAAGRRRQGWGRTRARCRVRRPGAIAIDQSASTSAPGAAAGGPVAARQGGPGERPTQRCCFPAPWRGSSREKSISARLRQKIHLLDHELIGSGSYEQMGRQEQRRFRLELKVPVGDSMSSFQRIHTGKYLWVCEELGSQTTLAQIDVELVRRLVAQRQNSRAGSGPAGGIAMPLEGLPKLLANLNDSFQFSIVRQGYLDQLAVWQLEGTWKPAVLAEWVGKQKEKVLAGEPINWKALPPQLPQRVVLTLGHDDLFPYRMEYLRESAAGKQNDPSGLGTIATLEFFEVRLGGPISPQRFVFQPGNRTVVNGTEAYLKQLGITERRRRTAASKAPAAVQR